MSNYLLSITKLHPEGITNFPGYFVVSTAPINVEDNSPVDAQNNPQEMLAEITQYLKAHEETAEIVVIIHGYNTPKSGVESWYKQACQDIAQQHGDSIPQGLVILGYRWSSEQVTEDESGKFSAKRKFARQSLPIVLRFAFQVGAIGIILGILSGIVFLTVFTLKDAMTLGFLLISSVILLTSLFIFSTILTLVLLRLSVYFRDVFRASNYGVSDLVELIRQLDHAMLEQQNSGDRAASSGNCLRKRIRLSFLGHSMGAFVVTNAVRVLSDVFDNTSIGSLNTSHYSKCPSPNIGNFFSLGRLVLVAPDIPAESIISGRANTLQSSLRRFEEAYLFSNEGDMALRLASTTANYFTFPTRTRDGGYRLGNVVAREVGETQQNAPQPAQRLGIVNQTEEGMLLRQSCLDYVYIRRSKPLSVRQSQVNLGNQDKPIAELFTYFDCTNYREKIIDPKTQQTKEIGIVSQALNKRSLSIKDYVMLTLDFFAGKIDTHGGYIFNPYAKFSKQAIYGLTCLGFDGFLASLQSDPRFLPLLTMIQTQQPTLTAAQQTKLAALRTLAKRCEAQGIQVLLAPERYDVNVLGQARDRNGY